MKIGHLINSSRRTNRTKLKLLYQKIRPKNEIKTEGTEVKMDSTRGTLLHLYVQERGKCGQRFNRPPPRRRTSDGETRRRGRKTRRRRFVLDPCSSSLSMAGHRTRHLIRAWVEKPWGACSARSDRHWGKY